MHPFQWSTVSTHIFRSKEQFLVRYAFFDLDETDFYNVSWPVSYAVLVRYDCDAYETQTLCLPFAAQSINLGDDTLIVLFFCFALFVCLLFSSFLSTTKPLNVLGYANSCKLHQKLMKGLIVELTALCNVSMPTRNVSRRWNFKVIPLVAQFYPVLSFHRLAQFARRHGRKATDTGAPVACVVFTGQFFQLLIQLIQRRSRA